MGDVRRKMEDFKFEKTLMAWLYLAGIVMIMYLIFSVYIFAGKLYEANYENAVANCVSKGYTRSDCIKFAR